MGRMEWGGGREKEGKERRDERRRRRERSRGEKRSGEEETVLPLTNSMSSREDRLLAPNTQAQLRSQPDLNSLRKWQGFSKSARGVLLAAGKAE